MKISTPARGILTNEVKVKAEKFLGREFTQKELRLYPYVCDCLMNRRRIDFEKIDIEELKILNLLQREERLYITDVGMCVTKSFYRFMQSILADTYVLTFVMRS